MEVDINRVLAGAQATLGAQLMEIIKLQQAVEAQAAEIVRLTTDNETLKAAAGQ